MPSLKVEICPGVSACVKFRVRLLDHYLLLNDNKNSKIKIIDIYK